MYAHMRFPEMSPAIKKIADKSCNNILQGLGLKEGGTALRVLTELSEAGGANVYELWRKMPGVGHYSTVLRALRKLEQENLVRVVPSSGEGRSQKICAMTLYGELILALVKDGWKLAAQLLAEKSSTFRDCIRAHFSRDPYYYWGLTRDIIEEIKTYIIIDIPDIEEIVRRLEIEWIEAHIVEELDNPSSRLWISKYLKRMSHAGWIRSELLPYLADYIEKERDWLQTLDGFKNDLLSVEKRAKLTQFFSEKKGEKA